MQLERRQRALFLGFHLKDAPVVLGHVLLSFLLIEKIKVGPCHCKVLTQVVGFSLFDYQAKQATTAASRFHAEIMRTGVSLQVEIIRHTVYSHPLSIHCQPCLDRRPEWIFRADDVDKSSFRRLLRKSLWPFFRVMGKVNTRGATSELLQALFSFPLTPGLLLCRWRT